MLVSILISARPGMPSIITSCLQSLVEKTVDKSKVEILIKVDIGDTTTLEAVNSFKDKLLIRVVEMDGTNAFCDLAVYTNELVHQSTGKFIWWWSDEVRILTQNWDNLLASFENWSNRIAYLHTPIANIPGTVYPMITRKWVEVTGRWSAHYSIDGWVNTIRDKLKGKIGNVILHNILIKDVTFMREIPLPPRSSKKCNQNLWWSDEIKQELQRDIDKINEYLARGG